MNKVETIGSHSSAWLMQVWLSFLIAFTTTAVGILFVPVDIWTKAFLGMGLLFTVGSTVSLSKTLRDQHEEKKLISRIDDAKVQRILSERSILDS